MASVLQSSPLSAPSSSSPGSSAPQGLASPFHVGRKDDRSLSTKHRAVKPLPYELKERCRIFFEESLHSQALTLLMSLLTAGNAFTDGREVEPAYVPPASHISLVATMAVHPSMTTRTRRVEKHQASVEALQYLVLLKQSVGSYNARLHVAYEFPSKLSLNRRGGASRRDDHSPERVDEDAITLEMAEASSVWTQAGDFWALTGWVFNCSVTHPRRWDVWLPWLEHIVEVLEDDWRHRKSAGEAAGSLLLKYVGEPQSRRILRAIFAAGNKQALQEFPEIWKKETAERKERTSKYEKVKVDFETEEFGKYFNVSSDESSAGDPLQEEVDATDGAADESDDNFIDSFADATVPDGTAAMGGAASITLRMRLFALLLQLAMEMPGQFTDAEALIGLFITYVRSYPLATFTSILSMEQLQWFASPAASVLVQSIACSLLEAAARRPDGEDLNSSILERSYLPWAANTSGARDNAKLAACIELLLRLYDSAVGLKWTSRFDTLVQQGIAKRETKAQRGGGRGRGDATAADAYELSWLRASGRRISLLLQLAYRRANPASTPA